MLADIRFMGRTTALEKRAQKGVEKNVEEVLKVGRPLKVLICPALVMRLGARYSS
jgi:hypothetical protein